MNGYASELNVTPLIDVLLVLVVMLIITVPVASHLTQLDLPTRTEREHRPFVDIDIDFDGRVFWEGHGERDGSELERWLVTAASARPQPLIRLWPDKRAPYERVAQVLAAAQRAHIEGLALAPVVR
jgi:biopolymer transport protein ExbD